MERWSGKVALVTGASVGVGPLVIQYLIQKGIKVVGIARRIEKIEEIARNFTGYPTKLYAIKCDISKEEDILKTIKFIKENIGNIHILINNAGFRCLNNFTDGTSQEWRKVFDVNVLGLCFCTREVVHNMREKNINGHIINLNTIVNNYTVNQSERLLNVHCTSKFAIKSFTEALSDELRQNNTRIKVTIINCGLIKSQFVEEVETEREVSAKSSSVNQEEIVGAILYALNTGPDIQIPEINLKPWGCD